MSLYFMRVSVEYADGSARQFAVDGNVTVEDFVKKAQATHECYPEPSRRDEWRFHGMKVLEVISHPTGSFPGSESCGTSGT